MLCKSFYKKFMGEDKTFLFSPEDYCRLFCDLDKKILKHWACKKKRKEFLCLLNNGIACFDGIVFENGRIWCRNGLDID